MHETPVSIRETTMRLRGFHRELHRNLINDDYDPASSIDSDAVIRSALRHCRPSPTCATRPIALSRDRERDTEVTRRRHSHHFVFYETESAGCFTQKIPGRRAGRRGGAAAERMWRRRRHVGACYRRGAGRANVREAERAARRCRDGRRDPAGADRRRLYLGLAVDAGGQAGAIVAYSFGNRPNAASGNTSSTGGNQSALPDPACQRSARGRRLPYSATETGQGLRAVGDCALSRVEIRDGHRRAVVDRPRDRERRHDRTSVRPAWPPRPCRARAARPRWAASRWSVIGITRSAASRPRNRRA